MLNILEDACFKKCDNHKRRKKSPVEEERLWFMKSPWLAQALPQNENNVKGDEDGGVTKSTWEFQERIKTEIDL